MGGFAPDDLFWIFPSFLRVFLFIYYTAFVLLLQTAEDNVNRNDVKSVSSLNAKKQRTWGFLWKGRAKKKVETFNLNFYLTIHLKIRKVAR